ncbi:hypothetical protein J3R82DRAFT_5134 [Butyriboletus roseoflavus]|nr:hypothetical protein J3R82DRAFT_5134 [Butyriboletus roseoflavus]
MFVRQPVEGVNIIPASWAGTRLSSGMQRVIAGAAAVPVMLGLWTLSKEPLMALSSAYYGACFMRLWV